MTPKILIIEDELILAKNMKAFLLRHGYQVMWSASGEEGLASAATFQPDLVLLDYSLPGMNGLVVLERLRSLDPAIKVVVITGLGSVEVAVQAMKFGAHDYLAKPVVLSELKLLVDNAVGRRPPGDTQGDPGATNDRNAGLADLLGDSASMLDLKQSIRCLIAGEYALADNDPPTILILGETGTGKELVARALHFEGQRRNRPFVEINCASIPHHLLEAELFGYERGAFTDAKTRKRGLVEEAEGGTLFMDEIGEVELSIQAKLLKVLEEKKVRRLGALQENPVNFRVIAATNLDLERRVAEGKFRADLYFRLCMMPLQVPPLRERGSDILMLAQTFLNLHGFRYRKPGLFFTAQAERALLAWPWPGNVRELRNTLEHVVLMAQDKAIDESRLPFRRMSNDSLLNCAAPAPGLLAAHAFPEEGLNLEKLEREYLSQALQKTAGNITRAAKLLGLSRDTLRYRMEKHGIRYTQ